EQKAIFFWNTIEAPGMVGCAIVGKIADALHPMTAPGTGIEERNDAEGLPGCFAEAATKGIAGDHVGRAGFVGIEQKIDARKQSRLGAIGGAPVQEEGALVLERSAVGGVDRE